MINPSWMTSSTPFWRSVSKLQHHTSGCGVAVYPLQKGYHIHQFVHCPIPINWDIKDSIKNIPGYLISWSITLKFRLSRNIPVLPVVLGVSVQGKLSQNENIGLIFIQCWKKTSPNCICQLVQARAAGTIWWTSP